MSTMTETAVTTQVYRVYIKATPEAIWDAITKPEWNERYGYPGGASTTSARAAPTARGRRRGAGDGDARAPRRGEVIEADPPRGSSRRGARPGIPTSSPRVSPASPGRSPRRTAASPS